MVGNKSFGTRRATSDVKELKGYSRAAPQLDRRLGVITETITISLGLPERRQSGASAPTSPV